MDCFVLLYGDNDCQANFSPSSVLTSGLRQGSCRPAPRQ
jgi:hypothetical protein